MAPPQRIVITGFMGAGKTTVAVALARLADCRHVDLDALITAREGRTPQQLIDEEGEAAFRNVETRHLGYVLADARARVIALGGGAWTLERNRRIIKEHDCLTVWLDAPFMLCWERITLDREEVRPNARDLDRAVALYGERREAYALAALRVHVTPESSAEEIAAEILLTAKA